MRVEARAASASGASRFVVGVTIELDLEGRVASDPTVRRMIEGTVAKAADLIRERIELGLLRVGLSGWRRSG